MAPGSKEGQGRRKAPGSLLPIALKVKELLEKEGEGTLGSWEMHLNLHTEKVQCGERRASPGVSPSGCWPHTCCF